MKMNGNSAEDVAAKEVYFLLFLCAVSETAPQTNDHSFSNSCWVIYNIILTCCPNSSPAEESAEAIMAK